MEAMLNIKAQAHIDTIKSGDDILWILSSRCAHEEVVQVSRDVETAAPLGEAHLVGILITGINHILLPIPTLALDIHW
jgi:hypothetical protein